MAYENTANKSLIRQQWDLPLLEQWRDQIGHQLSYFGLSGPRIHDLLDWRALLSYCTCVESPGRTKKERDEADETIGMFHTSIHMHGLSAITQLLVADVEDVILEGTDKYGYKPAFADAMPAHRMRFTYDLVNLDFDGGLGYKDKQGAAKRISALQKLFERQKGHSFLLLLTVNVRDTLAEEIHSYLRDLQALDRGADWHTMLDWYIARGDGEREYKLKATVPSFIRAVSEPHAFRCECYPPICYEGHRQAHMIHFAFEFTSLPRNLPGVSPQDDPHLLDLPLLVAANSELSIALVQHPGFQRDGCVDRLTFLPCEVRNAILSALPKS